MALFALIEDNTVANIALVADEKLTGLPQPVPAEVIAQRTFCVSVPGEWVQACPAGSFRAHCAEIGDTYDRENDVFIKPQPFNSWALDENYNWQPPVAEPTNGQPYEWHEESQSWQLIEEDI